MSLGPEVTLLTKAVTTMRDRHTIPLNELCSPRRRFYFVRAIVERLAGEEKVHALGGCIVSAPSTMRVRVLISLRAMLGSEVSEMNRVTRCTDGWKKKFTGFESSKLLSKRGSGHDTSVAEHYANQISRTNLRHRCFQRLLEFRVDLPFLVATRICC